MLSHCPRVFSLSFKNLFISSHSNRLWHFSFSILLQEKLKVYSKTFLENSFFTLGTNICKIFWDLEVMWIWGFARVHKNKKEQWTQEKKNPDIHLAACSEQWCNKLKINVKQKAASAGVDQLHSWRATKGKRSKADGIYFKIRRF